MDRLVSDKDLIMDKHGFKTYDFYPERKFDTFEFLYSVDFNWWGEILEKDTKYRGEIHYVPLYPESLQTFECLIIFYLAEMMNYKVVVYGKQNLFPLFSLISHKCVMTDHEIKNEYFLEDRSLVGRYSVINDFPTPPSEEEVRVSGFEEISKWKFNSPSGYFDIFMTADFDRLIPSSRYFTYDGNLVGQNRYPYYELIEQSETYPKVQEMVDFYKDKEVCFLESSYMDYENFISSTPIEGPDWFQYKAWSGEEYRKEIWFTWEKSLAFWVNGCGSVIQGTTSYLGNHEIQKKIVMEYTHSFLSIQILLSLYQGVRYNAWLGAAAFMCMIPQLNCRTLITPSKSAGKEFKKKINMLKFNQPVYYDDLRNTDTTTHIQRYLRWLREGE